ncbi:hypothetical protein AVEN_16643-1 [Araneus ventricosus]|uniref:Tc1-like transposase DDE domain-containing protein n=1 Tax=Araneus ventricosus TaxID=182803 RepID=A0A4Y2L1N8_ARAVE|nr:hypothetical protein AVEN_16643-1 [Araneus ventricosus]
MDELAAIHYALDDHWNASWFMQDGARPHRTPAVFDFLSEHFNDRVIALDYDKHTGSGMAWPPYSPDLTPCDFFLWGYLKRPGIPPNFTYNCGTQTTHQYSM